MINIKISNVEIGAEYRDVIYNFWITAYLDNGKEIYKIFDDAPFDFRNRIGKTFNVILLAHSIENITNNTDITNNVFTGYLTDKDIPVNELRYLRKLQNINNILIFKTNYGSFLIDNDTISKLEILPDTPISIYVPNFDLISYEEDVLLYKSKTKYKLTLK